MWKRRLISALIGILSVLPVSAENFPDLLLWGDTHVHSNNSPDAYFMGDRQLTPTEAYAFARGEPVKVSGEAYSINRPLDFLVVTDHAEYLGPG